MVEVKISALSDSKYCLGRSLSSLTIHVNKEMRVSRQEPCKRFGHMHTCICDALMMGLWAFLMEVLELI